MLGRGEGALHREALSGARVLALVVLVVLAGGGIAASAAVDSGVIGPQNRIQPSGRKLDPVGKLTKLGNAPAGGALTRGGGYLWTLSAGRGQNDIRIVASRATASGDAGERVVQTIVMPGLSGGIAMDPPSNTAYVSGVAELGSTRSSRSRTSVPGKQGDVIHVFKYEPDNGAGSTPTG